ncbi:MAG: hypothetical protein ACI8Q1_001376 [Parvicella sp.]|jgi:hypothetical protein
MVLGDLVEGDGIKLLISYETYALSETGGELGEKVTTVEVSKISSLPELENSHFEIPKGAKKITETYDSYVKCYLH